MSTNSKNKKYVFIMNSTKPSKEEYESVSPVKLTNFSRPCLKVAQQMGYEVILGVNKKYPEQLTCSEMDISFYNSHTFRNIFAIKDNYIAYKNLCNVLKQGDVEVIHCNTPIGGLVGRICGKKYNIPKIIYTAHGFHFYKGASLFNNTVIKCIEFFLARWTDVIITINEEDYKNAKKMKLKNDGRVYKVNGVGINLDEYQNIKIDRDEKRNELGLKKSDFVCISMGDLIKRKNYKMAIEAIAACNNEKIHYLICGEGPEKNNLIKLTHKLGLEKQVHFLGFRCDIKELLAISDCFLFTSLQEGLPRSLMEAMATGLPCIVSNIRGNKDLIKYGNELFDLKSIDELKKNINCLMADNLLCQEIIEKNIKEIQKYGFDVVVQQIKKIYFEKLI